MKEKKHQTKADMISYYNIAYVNSNNFTSDRVTKSKVTYGEEKLKTQILELLIDYSEPRHGDVGRQNEQGAATNDIRCYSVSI